MDRAPRRDSDFYPTRATASSPQDDVVLERLEDMLTTPPDFTVGSYGFEIHEMTEMAQADFGQYAHSNQPVHQFLFAFAAVGRPDRMHVHVDRVVRELYRPRADAYAGDEDNGEMSAWYVLASIGLLVSTIGTLCPERRAEVAGLGVRSWIAGNMATAMTGAWIGLITWV